MAEAKGAALPFPNRFRRRLIIAFVLVAGFAAGALATGSFILASQQRHNSFISRSQQQARVTLALTQGQASANNLNALVSEARQRNSYDTLVVADQTISSRPGLVESDLPDSVRNADPTKLASAFMKLGGSPYLVLGEDIPDSNQHARLYLLFSEKDVRDQLAQLRQSLIAGWIAVTCLSALIGRAIATRTLAPIQYSANAARSLAEGLLDTRLPDTRSDEFGAWGRYFNEMAAALETKITELANAHERERRFTADVAHDLRTPITAMVTSSALLTNQLEDLPLSARHPLELLIGDVERLRKLITDLLELGRLDAETEPSHGEPVNLPELIRRVCETPGVVATIDSPDVTVNVDRVRVERILANLVNNAVVHGGGNLQIHATTTDERLDISVADSGPGIPPDTLPHIFDRFHKASPSRGGEGSGLGLAIAAQHATVLGGTLQAKNLDGGGASFVLSIPVTRGSE